MYRNKIKNPILLVILGVYFLVIFSLPVFAIDSVFYTFPNQVASGSGSNNSRITLWASGGLSYVNEGNNSRVLENYLTGWYHDSVFGWFQTNWSTNQNENIRVTESTAACGKDIYGYKLGGYAYSPTAGYVDFDYNSDIFVYYCKNEGNPTVAGTLRGYSYSPHIGFQNFTGIVFDIDAVPTTVPSPLTSSPLFLNDTSTIFLPLSVPLTPDAPDTSGNIFQNTDIQFEVEKESFFYIFK